LQQDVQDYCIYKQHRPNEAQQVNILYIGMPGISQISIKRVTYLERNYLYTNKEERTSDFVPSHSKSITVT